MLFLHNMIKVRFLGTGTSQGVPVIACDCEVCRSKDIFDNRLRSSVLVKSKKTSVVIDTGPDFRQQILRANISKIDAVVFTHEHKDHVAGLDDIRAFNFKLKKSIDVYASKRVQEALIREFPYIFVKHKYPGVPSINLKTIHKSSSFKIGDLVFQPIEVLHYKLPVLGFRVNSFVYITDANFIKDEEMVKIKGCKILVLNALRKEKHISHFTLKEAISLSKRISPNKTFLTHISHLMGTHTSVSKELPPNIELAYDNLELEIN